jgi:molybdopterin-biosynthesis enzyme MoeA-like protein
MPTFGLLVLGDEILSGKRTDKHLPKTIELLAARGLALSYASYCGDEPARITQALRLAFESGDVVFSTGGIGATPDDHTRGCAGAALGVPMALHGEAAAFIHERARDLARDKGVAYDPQAAENEHRMNMAVFPQGAQIIPNPYNKIAGFSCNSPGGVGAVHFLPGFPVMAWPMMEWVLDHLYSAHFRRGAWLERSIVVMGSMEATLTPLMVKIESAFPTLKVFSLPSVDHPQFGRHIELGVKGPVGDVAEGFAAMLQGLQAFELTLGPEMVRET